MSVNAASAINSALSTVPAVITAGGRIDGAFAAAAGTTIKALVPIAEKPLLAHVLQALAESRRVGTRIVVGPEKELRQVLPAEESLRFEAEGATGPENIQRGLTALGTGAGEGWALLVTCDLPFLDGAAVQWLVDNAPEDADILFPILTKQEYDAVLPGSPNTYARLGGQEYTGGSVFLVRPAALLRNRHLIEQVFEARKSQVAMARLLGLPFVLRFLTGRLTVEQAQARACALTGCRCRVLPHAPVALAADIDTLGDYDFAKSVKNARNAGEVGTGRGVTK